MTAINVIRHPDAVHMLTDGAAWDPVGAQQFSIAKAAPLPHLNAAFAARGPALSLSLLWPYFGTASSYDDLKCRAAALVQEVWELHGELLERNPNKSFEIVVAGWSESSGPDSYVLTNRSDNPGVSPWTVTRATEVLCSPIDAETQRRWLATVSDNPKATDIRPEVEGLALMELQRATSFELVDSNDPARIIVGGFAQLTTITQDQINMRILRRWT